MCRDTRDWKLILICPIAIQCLFSLVRCSRPPLSRCHFTVDKDHKPTNRQYFFYTFSKRKCKARKCRIATLKRASWENNQLSAILFLSNLFFILSFLFFLVSFASLGVGVFVRCKDVDHSVHIHSPWSHSRLPFVGSTSKCISLSARSFFHLLNHEDNCRQN